MWQVFIGWANFEISSSRSGKPGLREFWIFVYEKKTMPRVSRRKVVLDTNIHAQTILDAIFESDDEEDVQVSNRRRMLSGSDSEGSDEDDGHNILMPVISGQNRCTGGSGLVHAEKWKECLVAPAPTSECECSSVQDIGRPGKALLRISQRLPLTHAFQ